MSRSPTTRLRSDAKFQVGVIPDAYARIWLPRTVAIVPQGEAATTPHKTQSDANPPIDPQSLFSAPGPVELEIGFGKGLFLTQQARARPDVRFIGIEWAWKFALLAAQRLEAAKVDNVRIFSCDARRLTPRFADGALQAIHVYFPDPWWKRRHRKRRMIDAASVVEFARLLQPGGRLLLATDVGEYFQKMQETVEQHSSFRRLDADVWPGPTALADPPTHFARKYLEQGRELFFVGYELRPTAGSDS